MQEVFPTNPHPLLLFHLSQEQKNRGDENDEGIAENPPQMREDARIVARDNGALHLDGMDKGQGIGDLFEHAAHEVKVEPNAREPRGEVGQECSANAAHLLVVENASTKESKPDIQKCYGDEEHKRQHNIGGNVQAQNDGKEIGRHALGKRYGNERQGVTENKIHGRHRSGVKAVHKAALPIFCNDGSRKQRHKRKSEYRNTRREMRDLKQTHGDVCLNGTQQKQEYDREAEEE